MENVAQTETPSTADTLVDDGDVPEATLESPTRDEQDGDPEPPRITFSISALENPSDADRSTADSLRQFLSTSETANHLLGKTFLTRSSRHILVEGIVNHLYATNDGVLSNPLLQSWARAVEQVFHDEISELYFRQSEDGSFCEGKLAQYYKQLKQMNGVAESS